MNYVLGITLVIIVGIITYLSMRGDEVKRKNKIQSTFEGRDSLTPVEFYEKYYKEKGVPLDVVLGVRKILEGQLDADLSQLLSEDDFTKNLQFFFEFDSMADVEIIIALEKDFGIKIEDSEAEKTCTINDIIMLVTNKVKNA